ncbi:outer membrane beta-barrel protein [uncultured Brachyspira sp.]|uniref:outer membrane beta-barrel protein n=1 Tax=uncultured Brachyspira sp. TaxID=221953 RepID=UPI0025F89872|nr:outer membrane beta-barrel protein [uncultured Brachyspira sp.]
MLASSFEFEYSASAGVTLDFSYNNGNFFKELDGFRLGSGFSFSVLLSLGRNDRIDNNILTSISSMIETGYNYYERERLSDEYYYYQYDYHSIILGYLLKLNFHNKVSLGIGAGIYIPLYGTEKEFYGMGGDSKSMEKLNQKNIAFMHKIPFMPYVKLNVVRYFYLSDRWAFKIGGSLTYNFGMEFDTVKLADYFVYDKYNFSSLNIEVYAGFSFGRPK